MSILPHTDQLGQKFTANGDGALPLPGSKVTLPNGTGQTNNAIWTGTVAVPINGNSSSSS